LTTTLCLASGSPRRREILEWAGFEVIVRPGNVDETWNRSDSPIQHATRMAERKAHSVHWDGLLLAGDTVVHLENEIFDKPQSESEAIHHLQALAGRWHQVSTGVCIRMNDRDKSFATTTRVRMRDLSDTEIKRYVSTGESQDKAGAYGIQGIGGNLVAEIEGSWTNVKGLPLEATLENIRTLLRGVP